MTSAVVAAVEKRWSEPDRGLWEVRGPNRHFVHSKVLAWVAFDRAITMIERFGVDGPVDRWRALRAQIHADVCAQGYDPKRETFTQSYGSRELDAATLLIPLVGFLPPDDPRVKGTVRAIERELLVDGFVRRYSQPDALDTDGLPPGEGAFYACGFWLADNYVLQNRRQDARALFERLIGTANDVGLLSEEYDVGRNGWSATFRKRSRTSDSSTPRTISPASRNPPTSAAAKPAPPDLRRSRVRASESPPFCAAERLTVFHAAPPHHGNVAKRASRDSLRSIASNSRS